MLTSADSYGLEVRLRLKGIGVAGADDLDRVGSGRQLRDLISGQDDVSSRGVLGEAVGLRGPRDGDDPAGFWARSQARAI